ncbi:hypothetical protein hrd7_25120 [Leptolinea sp. HRD-7]|nr:hypothetical protein hrd7_25120 [Leptolinea sp. HRD-7]
MNNTFEKNSAIKAVLYFMESGDYIFKWKEDGRISHKCLAAPDVSAAFSKSEIDSGFIPSGVIRHGYGTNGPWAVLEIEPAREEITLINPGGNPETISVMFPRLMMVGAGKDYYLVALTDPFIVPEAKAFRAPFTNVHPDHRICWGLNNPPVAEVSNMKKAWRLFIESGFNADLAAGKSRQFDNDIRKAWKKYSKKPAWPITDLMPARETVGSIIKDILR